GATRVVLPAPGGATTTALGFSSSAAMMSGSTASIGSAGLIASIGARDREGDRFGQRRFRLAGAEAADRVDRALAIVTRARQRVGDRIVAVEQRRGVGEVLVRNLVAGDRLLPEFALLGT